MSISWWQSGGILENKENQSLKNQSDVFLILSLFTGREIFASVDDRLAIVRDSRPYLCYETLGVSIPSRLEKNETGELVDLGFIEGIEKVIRLIHTSEWLDKFEGGTLLFIARQIYTFQILEKAFFDVLRFLGTCILYGEPKKYER